MSIVTRGKRTLVLVEERVELARRGLIRALAYTYRVVQGTRIVVVGIHRCIHPLVLVQEPSSISHPTFPQSP